MLAGFSKNLLWRVGRIAVKNQILNVRARNGTLQLFHPPANVFVIPYASLEASN